MKSSHWPLLLPSAVQLLEVTRHGLVCPSHMVGADTCLVQLVLIQHLCCSLHLVVGKAIEDVYTAEPKHKVDAHEDGGVRPALDSVKAAGTDYRHQVLDRPGGGAKLAKPTTQVPTGTIPLALNTRGKSLGWAMRRWHPKAMRQRVRMEEEPKNPA